MEELESYSNDNIQYRKSNTLIASKMHNNLLTNKIYAIAMTRIELEGSKEGGKLVAELYPGEIRRLVGGDKNIYTELKTCATLMTSQNIAIEDGEGNFAFFSVVKEASYQDRVFRIEFNDNIRPHILKLTSNYTTLNLGAMTGFEKNFSFRLYEILKSHAYQINPKVNGGIVDVSYNLNELRFMIGAANLDEEKVQRYIARNRNKSIDWDYLFNTVCKEKKYTSWSDFRRYVLVPVQKELKETADIAFDFEGVKLCGNKIARVLFHIFKNTPSTEITRGIHERSRIIEETSTNIQYDLDDYMYRDMIDEFEGHNYLTKKDIILFMQKAGDNEELVQKAIEAADAREHVRNYVGWIVSYIEKGGYEEPVETIRGSAEQAKNEKDFMAQFRANTSSIAASVWSKTKQKADFPLFEQFLKDNGSSIEQIEVIYSEGECVDLYVEWKKNQV